jgi:hypothetical protein
MLRVFKVAKDSAVKARTQAIDQLKAVLVAADPALREALSGLTNTMLIRRCAQLELRSSPSHPKPSRQRLDIYRGISALRVRLNIIMEGVPHLRVR